MTGAAPQYAIRRDDRLPGPSGSDDDGTGLVETWPRTAEGAIAATNRASWLSAESGVPHEVRLPDGRLLARFVGGKRADL